MKKLPNKSYHCKQHKKIYGSTVEFVKFIETYINLNKKNIIDLGCGSGANTIYLAKKYPQSNFLGIDSDRRLIVIGNKFKKNKNNIKFEIGDWRHINSYKKFIFQNKISKNIVEGGV